MTQRTLHLVSFAITIAIVGGVLFLSTQESSKRFAEFLTKNQKQHFSQLKKGERDLVSHLRLVSGELNVFPIQDRHLYGLLASYRLEEGKPLVTYRPGPTGQLTIQSSKWRQLGVLGKDAWSLGLSKEVLHDLNITTHTARQNLNLSGIPLKHLAIKSGTSRLNLYFNISNPVSMSEMSVRSGATDCRIFGLLRARAKTIHLEGAGRFLLDFSGTLSQSSFVSITGGIGKLKLLIPAKANARIQFSDRLLTVFNIQGFYKISENQYISDTFDPDKPVLDITVKIKSGSLLVKAL